MIYAFCPVQSPPKGVTIPYRPKPSGSPVIFAGGQVHTIIQRERGACVFAHEMYFSAVGSRSAFCQFAMDQRRKHDEKLAVLYREVLIMLQPLFS